MPITPLNTSTTPLATRTNTAVTRPPGTVTGDVVVVALTSGATTLTEPANPGGWTLMGKTSYAAPDPYAVSVSLWVKPYDGAGSWTWTHAASSSQAFALALRGVDLTTIEDVAATTAFKDNYVLPADATAPSFTTITADAWAIVARGSWDGNAITPPAGWIEQYDLPVMWVGTDELVTAGATGAVVLPSGNTGNSPWGIVMGALRPAAAPTQDEATKYQDAMAAMTAGMGF